MFKLIQGDGLTSLRGLPSDSVNCCVTSPPYWGLRDYGAAGQVGLEKSPDEYVEKMAEVFSEVWRVLKPDGTLWLNLGDSYAAGGQNSGSTPEQLTEKQRSNGGCRYEARKAPLGMKPKDLVGIPWMVAFALRTDGWYLRQDIIWAKPNPMPESVRDRCTRSHEFIFLFSKAPRYYYDSKAIEEPTVSTELKKFTDNGRDKQRGHSRRHAGFNGRYAETLEKDGIPKTRNKRDVWFVAPHPFRGAHFATFPPKLIEPCILAGCPIDGTVLDPFCGSGTTGVVALQHGRNFIGLELNPEYVEMSRKRILDSIGEVPMPPPASEDWITELIQ